LRRTAFRSTLGRHAAEDGEALPVQGLELRRRAVREGGGEVGAVQAAAGRLGIRGWMSKDDMRLLPALLRAIYRNA